jgi:hypothetical protein
VRGCLSHSLLAVMNYKKREFSGVLVPFHGLRSPKHGISQSLHSLVDVVLLFVCASGVLLHASPVSCAAASSMVQLSHLLAVMSKVGRGEGEVD